MRGWSRITWKESLCPSGGPPYPITYNHCRTWGSQRRKASALSTTLLGNPMFGFLGFNQRTKSELTIQLKYISVLFFSRSVSIYVRNWHIELVFAVRLILIKKERLKMAYADVFKKIGSFGRYQKFIYVLQTLPVVFTAVQTYLSVFILYVPDHR